MTISKIRPIRSYVLRQGRLTKHQSEGIKLLSPLHAIPFGENFLNWNSIFASEGKRIIEIGFGMGHTTAEIAETLSHSNFIAIEVHSPGVGNLLNKINSQLENLKIIQHDAIEVMNEMIPEQSIDRLQLYFPDPWHKKKHNKRRIVQSTFVQQVRTKLRPGGILHMATDWQHYAEHNDGNLK